MAKKNAPQEHRMRRHHIGQFVSSGDWSDYWTTRISRAEGGRIRVRGYPVEELIEHLSYTESAFLLLTGELPDGRQQALFDLASAHRRSNLADGDDSPV